MSTKRINTMASASSHNSDSSLKPACNSTSNSTGTSKDSNSSSNSNSKPDSGLQESLHGKRQIAEVVSTAEEKDSLSSSKRGKGKGKGEESATIGSKIPVTLDEHGWSPNRFACTGKPEEEAKRCLDVTNTMPMYDSLEQLTGRFGSFGGRYIPETLVESHEQLERIYIEASQDPSFQQELEKLGRDYIGRPTPLFYASRLSEHCGGAQIWIKREDLAHTGAHKINNALGQCLLAKKIGKERVIAETGAGQHGVAVATACALLGLKCQIWMGETDMKRQALNVFRIQMLGGEVKGVSSGTKTLKDAVNEAMRDWVTNVRNTHYIIGSAIGPHPFPTIVRDFQSVIGRETRAQCIDQCGKLPELVVACVGGGSNAIGMFYPFKDDAEVKLLGVEAGGEGNGSSRHSSTLSAGRPGVLHGTRTYLLQSDQGQISETHSISAGLDYPGVGPEHAFLKESGRAEYVNCSDKQALAALHKLSELEGIIPALETAHAVHSAMERAKSMAKDDIVVITLSGRGDKDMVTVAQAMGVDVSSMS